MAESVRIGRNGEALPHPRDYTQEYLAAILDELQALNAVLAQPQAYEYSDLGSGRTVATPITGSPTEDAKTPTPVSLEEPASAAAEELAGAVAAYGTDQNTTAEEPAAEVSEPAAEDVPAPPREEPGPTAAAKPTSPKRTTRSAAKRKPAASKAKK